MGHGRPVTCVAAFALALFCSALSGSSLITEPLPRAAFDSAVWVGGTIGTSRIAAESAQVEWLDPAAGDVYSLSLDSKRGLVWQFNGTEIRISDFQGRQLKAVPVPQGRPPLTSLLRSPSEATRDSITEDVFCLADGLVPRTLPGNLLWPLSDMATDAGTGRSWLAIGDQLHEFSADGELLGSRSYGALITGLAADPERSRLWVSTCRSVNLHDFSGSLLFSRPAAPLVDFVKDIEFDAASDRLWVAARRRVLALDGDGELLLDQSLKGQGLLGIVSNLGVLAEAEYVAGDGQNGVWVAAGGKLRRMDQTGATLTSLDVAHALLPLPGVPLAIPDDIVGIAANPTDQSVWAATRQRLLRVSATGEVGVDQPLPVIAEGASTNPIGLPLQLLQPLLGAQSRLRTLAMHARPPCPLQVDILSPKQGRTYDLFDESGDPNYYYEFDITVAYRNCLLERIDQDSWQIAINDGEYFCENFSEFDDRAVRDEDWDQGVELADVQLLHCLIYLREDAPFSVSVSVEDLEGGVYETGPVGFRVDNHPPDIQLSSPAMHYTSQDELDPYHQHDNFGYARLTATEVLIQGQVSEPSQVTINGGSVPVSDERRFSHRITGLSEGGDNYVEIAATDLYGRTGMYRLDITVDTVPPKPLVEEKIAFISRFGITTIIAGAGTAEPLSIIRIRNVETGEVVTAQVQADGSFNAQIVAAIGEHLELVSADEAGNQSPTLLREIQEPLYIQILTPTAQSTVSSRGTIVSGTVIAPVNSGVTVNGELATVVHGDPVSHFSAFVPIDVQDREITATVRSSRGNRHSSTIKVKNVNTPAHELIASPAGGVAPLKVNFDVVGGYPDWVSGIQVDFDDDGVIDLATRRLDTPLTFDYVVPGSYLVHITDSYGNSTDLYTRVVVTDTAREQQVIQGVWSGFREALEQGDKDAALSQMSPDYHTQYIYGQIFDVLAPNMNEVLAEWTGIYPVEVSASYATYVMATAGETESASYVLNFLRDGGGVWRLHSM